jgi:hypothetical protein
MDDIQCGERLCWNKWHNAEYNRKKQVFSLIVKKLNGGQECRISSAQAMYRMGHIFSGNIEFVMPGICKQGKLFTP